MIGLLVLLALLSGPSIKLRVDKQIGIAPLPVKVSIVVPPHEDNRKIVFETSCDGFVMEQAEIPLAGAEEKTSQYLREVVLREPCGWILLAGLETSKGQLILTPPIEIEVK